MLLRNTTYLHQRAVAQCMEAGGEEERGKNKVNQNKRNDDKSCSTQR